MAEYSPYTEDLRIKFALNAPVEVPGWFQVGTIPEIPYLSTDHPLCYASVDTHMLSDSYRNGNFVKKFCHESGQYCRDLKVQAAEYATKVVEYQDAYAKWVADNDGPVKYFAWRWHYADQMVGMKTEQEDAGQLLRVLYPLLKRVREYLPNKSSLPNTQTEVGELVKDVSNTIGLLDEVFNRA